MGFAKQCLPKRVLKGGNEVKLVSTEIDLPPTAALPLLSRVSLPRVLQNDVHISSLLSHSSRSPPVESRGSRARHEAGDTKVTGNFRSRKSTS